MAKKWREILQDPNSFPDDFVVDLKGGGTMTLGQMRAEDKESEGALTQRLTAREQEIANKEREVGAASGQVAKMFEEYLSITGLSAEEALAGKKATKKEVAATAGLDENDPLIAPMVKELNAMKAELASVRGEIKNQQDKVFKPVVQQYLNDYYEGTYENRIAPKLPAKAKDKVTLDALMKHAESNGLKDKSGRLNLQKAAEELTSEYRIEDEVEKRTATRMKKMQDEATLASVQKPGSGPRGKPAQSFLDTKGHTKSFDAVLQDAANDAELWNGLGGQA